MMDKNLYVIVLLVVNFCAIGMAMPEPVNLNRLETSGRQAMENRLYQISLEARNLVEKGMVYQADSFCNEGISLAGSNPGSRYLGYLYTYKGSAQLQMANYYLAWVCYRLGLHHALVFGDTMLFRSIQSNLGSLAMRSNDYDLAEELYSQLDQSGGSDEMNDFHFIVKENMAALAIRRGDIAKAEDLYRVMSKYNSPEKSFLYYRNLGRLQLLKNQIAPARVNFYHALDLSSGTVGKMHYETGLCYYYIGQYYEKTANSDSAGTCYELAVRILSAGTLNDTINQANWQPFYETVLLDCIITQAGFFAKKPESLEFALERFKTAINRILFLSHSITSESSRFIISAKGRKAFNGGIACALRLYEKTNNPIFRYQAFEWTLQSKSLSLNWLIEKDLVYSAAGIPGHLVGQLQQYRYLLNLAFGDSFIKPLQLPADSVSSLIRLYEDTEKQIRRKYQGIRKAIMDFPVSRYLTRRNPGGEQYLGYYDLDTLIVLFGLSRGKFNLVPIRKDIVLMDEINRFRQIVSAPAFGLYGRKEIEEYGELGTTLFNKLVKSVLTGRSRKRLVIHPDGLLLGFPFEALIVSGSRVETFRELPYLFRKYRVRYVSTPLLINKGNPHHGRKVPVTIITCNRAEGLPAIMEEIEAIRRRFADTRLVYAENSPDSYDFEGIPPGLIHISSHLTINQQDPLKTAITCSGNEDSFMTFGRVVTRSLAGSMVMINACESGTGPVNYGEGLMSMGLAFSLAGCTTIVQHLWKASDQSSAMLSALYYRHLVHCSPASALTRAKKKYLKIARPGFDHPFYWAGLVCFSDRIR
jgi:CHAT domain-containing protein